MSARIRARVMRRGASMAIGLGALWGALAALPAPALAASDSCPNAEVRALQSASYLPECRAYELVSPPEKEGNSVAADPTMTQSALNGDAVKWTSTKAFGGAYTEIRGAEYVSQRGGASWSTDSINPEQAGPFLSLGKSQEYQELSEDLTKGVYWALSPVLGGYPNVEKNANLYLRTDVLSGAPGTYELLSDAVAPLPARPSFSEEMEIHFADASSDWSRIIFDSVQDLTANAAGTSPELPKLYEWHNGTVTLVGLLPGNATVAKGSVAGASAGIHSADGTWTREAMSNDGSRVVFTAAPFSPAYTGDDGHLCGTLYMRIGGTETVPVNVDERSETDPNGAKPACFWTATPDESHVFFTSYQALTNDAEATTNNVPIMHYYRYDLEAPTGKHLTLLTQGKGLGGIGPTILGVSADGSYAYFTFSAALHEGDPEHGGIYVWHEGTTRFVARHYEFLLRTDLGEGGRSRPVSFRVTPDGKTALFLDQSSEDALSTGYDNKHISEIMVYSYDASKLICASCDPSGAPPVGEAGNNAAIYNDGADLYGETEYMANMYKNRTLSDDGRYAFFDTPDPLVPEDTNGRRDVYEYDMALGRAELLSGGTCNCDSSFVDATPDGSNVFFTTHQSLVRADFDTAGDLYDARITGGILAQNVPAPAACEGDDCQGSAKAAPLFSAPASSTFAGSGNPSATGAPPSPHGLTRAQKLTRALRACHAKRGKRRLRCEARARKRYGLHKSGTASHRAGR